MGSRELREQSSRSSFVIRQSDGRNQQWAARGHFENWKGEAVSLLVTEGSSFRPQRFARVCVSLELFQPLRLLAILKKELRFTNLDPCYTRVFPPLHRKMPYIYVCMCGILLCICRPQGFMNNVNAWFVSILGYQEESPMAQYEPFRCTFLNDPRYTPQLRFANVSDSGANHHERETKHHWRRAGRTWSKVPRFRSGVFRGTFGVYRLWLVK